MYLTIQLKVNVDENSHKLMRTYYLVNILRIQYGHHIIQDYKSKRIFGHVIAYINSSRFVLTTPTHQYHWKARICLIFGFEWGKQRSLDSLLV